MIEVRDYRTERINRARLELELKRAARSGVIVAIALIAGALIALHIAGNIGATFGAATQVVSFRVEDANDVVANSDEVRYLGIPVGRVQSVTMDGSQPVITAAFQTKYGHIYRDARVVVRPNTALEDMYVDVVNPGSPSAGLATSSDPLPAGQTDTSINIDDVLNVFNSDTRASLRTLLNNLGNGLADRGAALRQAFVQAVPFIQAAGRLSQQLADRSQLVAQLVHNTGVLTSDLASNQASLRRLIGQGSATLTTLEAHSPALSATLAALPATVADLRSSLASVSGVVAPVDTAIRSLYPVAERLPASLSALRSLSDIASPAIRALQTPVRKLAPLARYLVPLSSDLRDAVTGLLPQVPALDQAIRDIAGCRTGVQGFFQWDPSIAKYGDLRGQAPRGNVVVGAGSSELVTGPFEQAPAVCISGKPIGGRVATPADYH